MLVDAARQLPENRQLLRALKWADHRIEVLQQRKSKRLAKREGRICEWCRAEFQKLDREDRAHGMCRTCNLAIRERLPYVGGLASPELCGDRVNSMPENDAMMNHNIENNLILLNGAKAKWEAERNTQHAGAILK